MHEVPHHTQEDGHGHDGHQGLTRHVVYTGLVAPAPVLGHQDGAGHAQPPAEGDQ